MASALLDVHQYIPAVAKSSAKYLNSADACRDPSLFCKGHVICDLCKHGNLFQIFQMYPFIGSDYFMFIHN